MKRTGNSIGTEGARVISETLKSNSTLIELWLQSDDEREEMRWKKRY